jgi:MFS family permease
LRTAPRDALIADSISESNSGKAFGIHMTIDQTGAIVGPIAAFALLQVMDIRRIFLVSLVPSAIFTEGGNSLYAYVLAAVFWNLCRNFRDIAKGSST